MNDTPGEETERGPGAEPSENATAPFVRFVPAGELPGRAGRNFAERADDAEREAIAAFFDLVSLDELAIEGRFEPAAGDLWRLAGRLRAKAVQSCVVTLDPVRALVDEPIERLYAPGAAPTDPLEVDLDQDEDDPPEPLGAGVDLGGVALECLALALDPYPRAKGAVFEGRAATPPGAEPITPEAMKPFAGLAALKKSLEDPD